MIFGLVYLIYRRKQKHWPELSPDTNPALQKEINRYTVVTFALHVVIPSLAQAFPKRTLEVDRTHGTKQQP